MSSFGQLGSLAGNLIGSYFGPIGGAIGSAIGGYIGSSFDPAIINQGPRLSDLKLQNGAYGTSIAVSFGTSRVAGTCIYLTDIRETKTRTNAGKGGQKTYNDTYTYDLDCAIVLTDQHGFPVKGITGVRRIWANGALVHSNSEDATLGTLVASSEFCDQVTIYPGDYNQLPDPTLEADLGAGNVSAYRGFAYAVFRGVKVTSQGSPLPQFEFEVVQGGVVSVAKQIFASYQPPTTDHSNNALAWCNGSTAMVANYNLSNTAVDTTFYQLGDNLPEVHGYSVDNGYSGFPRQFANCGTAPIMFDVNYVDSSLVGPVTQPGMPPTGGMALRIWDMRASSTNNTSGQGANFLVAIRPISVLSYPYYTATGISRVAYEEGSGLFAFGVTGGDSHFYGKNLVFSIANPTSAGAGSAVGANTVLPAGRALVDLAIYQSILYVWNRSTVDGMSTWITAWDGSGTMLFDLPHVSETWSNAGYDWARLCVNEFGTFTWHSGTYNAQVNRFTPNGPQLLCADSDSGPGDQQCINNGGIAFWTDGSIANIGTSVINSYGQTSHFWTIQFQAITKGTVELGYALSVIASIAGLDPATEIDVSQQTQTLRGYCYKQVGPATGFIEPLCRDFYVEGFESEGKLKFKNLGGETEFDIPYDDLGFGAAEQNDNVDLFPLTRTQEKDLPRSLTVVYANWDADFQVGAEQPSKRLITSSVNDVVLETPITATADESIKRQDVLLYKAWLERDTRTASLSRRYVALETSDAVMVECPRGTWTRYRVTHVDYQGSFSNYVFVRDEPDVLISSAKGSNVARGQGQISFPAAARVALLDIPILRDADNAPGFYDVLYANGQYQPSSLFEQQSSGDYTEVSSSSAGATVGATLTVLGDWVGGNTVDTQNKVRVQINPGKTLNSSTISALIASGASNAMLIGQEIVQFATATVVSAGVYDLSIFLRYRRGTKWAPAHAISERVVLLEQTTLRRVADQLTDRNVAKSFKAALPSADITKVAATAFADTEIGLMPFAPVDVKVTPTTPTTVTWNRRSRLVSRFLANLAAQPPLGEATESYEVDVLAPDGSLVTTLQAATNSVTIAGYLPIKHLNGGLSSSMWQGQQYGNYLFGLSAIGSSTAGDQYLSVVSYDLTTGQFSSALQIKKDNFVSPTSPSCSILINGSHLILANSGVIQMLNISDLLGKFLQAGGVGSPVAVGAFSSPQSQNGAFAIAPNGIWYAFNDGINAWLANLATADLSVISRTIMSDYPTFIMPFGKVVYSSGNSCLYAIVNRSDTGFGVEEFDVSTSTPVRSRGIQISGPFAYIDYADITVFGSILCVGMPDGVRIYDLATLTLRKVISSATPIPTSGSYPYLGMDMFTVTVDGKLAFYDNSRGGFVLVNADTTIASIVPITGNAQFYYPRMAASTSAGLVIFAPKVFSGASPGSLDLYTFANFSSGYTARVYQISAAVGRGFGSEAVALA